MHYHALTNSTSRQRNLDVAVKSVTLCKIAGSAMQKIDYEPLTRLPILS